MVGLPSEISQWLLAQGPAGVVVLILIGVIIYLFRRWDADREELIKTGIRNAELALTCAEVIKAANANATSFIESMSTFKLITDLDRRNRP